MTQEKFLEGVETWSNHRVLLWLALELTKDSSLPVAEFGCGFGSTPFLREYCKINKREFRSYESNEEWAEKCGSKFIADWSSADIYHDYSVVLIDHAPGEHRHEAAAIFRDKAEIVVLHDSEEGGSGNYQFDKIWHMYTYRLNHNKRDGGAGSTALSNKHNLHIYDGHKVGDFLVTR